MKMAAHISPCGHYRYALERSWDSAKEQVLFIGLNPSTADHSQEDQTSRVCINYARRWGFGSLIIANLFAFRSTDPKGIRNVSDPVGPENDKVLKKLSKNATLIVCAWSDAGGYLQRDQTVLPWINQPHCLALLKSGRPGHPLYKSRTLKPQPMHCAAI